LFNEESHLGDVVKYERGNLTVTESVLLIMALANKATKFEAYRDPALPISELNQAQYEIIMQERHEVSYWNHIITAVKVV
jgi:hypothetical protein